MLGSVLKQLLKKSPKARARDDGDWLQNATALHQAGRHAEAAAVCRAQLAARPGDLDALQALAAALLAQGFAADGLLCLREAIEREPSKAELHANVAAVYASRGQVDAAIGSYRRALSLRKDLQDVWLQLIALLKATERYDEAEDCCREALAEIARSARLRHALAGVIFEQGCVDEAITELRVSLALDPNAPFVHSDLLRALNYADGQRPIGIFLEHRAWGERHANPLTLAAAAPKNDLASPRRLRVGYVSPYFRKHAVTFFLESVIEHHDRDAFDILLYADVARPDAYSERLKSYGAQWRSTVGASDEKLAEMARNDGVDILVDLSGHTPSHRLLAFARRPAPVQVTWNGYPNTTGMDAMDYRITDAYCDPPVSTEDLHTERLVRLPRIYMSWRPPSGAPEPGPLPALAAGRITFGSFNSCFKITPATIRLWSNVLSAVPDSRLIILTVTGKRAADRILEGFAACGIDTKRLELRPRVAHESFLAAHCEVDIALDTFPYHGTTTTCFSLWMGVPVVTLTGVTHVSRVGLSLLSNVGLEELAVSRADEYVATATQLAGDREALARIRSTLRQRVASSPLTDGVACARALELAYTEMSLASRNKIERSPKAEP
jgi:protein O-GlcNAc transferase